MVLLLRFHEFVTRTVDKLPTEALRHTRTLDTLTQSVLAALKVTLFIDGTDSHIVVTHDEERGQLTPAGNHLVTLLTGIVVQVLLTGGTLQLCSFVLHGLPQFSTQKALSIENVTSSAPLPL